MRFAGFAIGPLHQFDVERHSDRFQAQLKKREAQAIAELDRTYISLLEATRATVSQLEEKIAQALAAGLEPKVSWVLKHAHGQELIDKLKAELQERSAEFDRAISLSQADAALMGSRFATQALEGVGVRVQAVPIEAVNRFVGAARDGSPLAAVFTDYAGIYEGRVKETIAKSLGEGWGARRLGSELNRIVQTEAPRRGKMIARQETIRAFRSASSDIYRANSSVVLALRWICTKDKRTCAACLSMDGRLFPVDYVQTSHVLCRCPMVPVTRLNMEQDGLTAQQFIDANRGDREWFEDRFGKVGSRLLESGHLSLRDFARPVDSPEWGRAFVPAPGGELYKVARDRDPGLPSLKQIGEGNVRVKKHRRSLGRVNRMEGELRSVPTAKGTPLEAGIIRTKSFKSVSDQKLAEVHALSKDLMEDWVAGHDSPRAIKFGQAVAAELNLKGFSRPLNVDADTAKALDALTPSLRQAARYIYERTQAELASERISTRILLRGVSSKKPLANALTSWSEEQLIAEQYAGARGEVFKQRFKKRRVFSWHRSALWPDDASEREFLILDSHR